jgi:hypothetical protein
MPNPSGKDDGLKQTPATSVERPAPKAKPSQRPPASKAEHAALKRADKRVAKPWMKKR